MHLQRAFPFIALSSLAAAQSPFLEPSEVTVTAESPRALVVADFDGDGLDDVVAGSDRLLLTRSLGAQGLGPARLLSDDTLDINTMASGDLDGDGDVDLMVTDSSAGGTDLVWYENAGIDQFFRRRTLLTSILRPTRMKLVDVDADGDLDVVHYVPATDSLVWYEVDQGTVSPMLSVISPFGSQDWRFEDADQDGLDDLILERFVPGSGGDIFVARGVSAGSFAPLESLFGGLALSKPPKLQDMDADGDLDGVFSMGEDIFIAEATAPLVFSAPVSINLVGSIGSPTLDFVADINADGLIDILYTAGIPPFQLEQRWVQGLPGGGFSASQGPGLAQGLLGPGPLRDISGDGRPDIVGGGFNRVTYALNETATGGFFSSVSNIETRPLAHRDTALVDVDGDGDLDVLGLREISTTFGLYENDGQGSFTASGAIAYSGERGREVSTHDFDQDGDDDILMLAGTPNVDRVVILRNDGGGVFVETLIYTSTGLELSDPQVDDIDGDGDLDVMITAGFSSSALRLLRNEGAGLVFTEILVGLPARSTLADIDGDGLPDLSLLRPAQTQFAVTWRRNLGGSAFAPEGRLLDAFGFSSVTVSDMDGDGAADIILNQGGTSFVAYAITPGSQYGLLTSLNANLSGPLERLVSFDINGDGRQDLVSGSDNSLPLVWINPGAGATANVVEIFPSTGALGAARFGDLDGDGDLDAVGTADRAIWSSSNGSMGQLGTNVCGPANQTSLGTSASISAFGNLDLSVGDVTLSAEAMPLNATGLFLVSRSVGAPLGLPGSQGTLCLTGAIGRFSLPFELQNSGAAGATSNLTDAISLTF